MILLNGAKLPVVRFSNGETKIELKPILENAKPYNVLTLRFDKHEGDRDLIRLMCIKGFLDNNAEGIRENHLKLLYMPYSRMDRLNEDSVFSLKYVAELINSMNFDTVTVLEPHSDVTPALLDKCVIVNGSLELFDSVAPGLNVEHVYFPDSTAAKRYSDIGTHKHLIGHKKRDFATGTILNLEVFGDVPDEPFDVIMIDDLCARGGTFKLGAEKLRKMGADNIYIVCAHCEDTVLEGALLSKHSDKDLIQKMYTTDSIFTERHEKINVTKITE